MFKSRTSCSELSILETVPLDGDLHGHKTYPSGGYIQPVGPKTFDTCSFEIHSKEHINIIEAFNLEA
jgi:hypothetical protein